MIYFSNRTVSSRGGFGCLLSGIVGILLLYLFFKLLWWAAPALLVLAVIINWRSVADTGKQYLGLLRSNPVMGIIIGVLGVVLFPVLALFLFVQSLAYKQIKGFRDQFGGGPDQQQQTQDTAEYADFEELESTPKTDYKQVEIPEIPDVQAEELPPAPGKKDNSNPYDQIFE